MLAAMRYIHCNHLVYLRFVGLVVIQLCVLWHIGVFSFAHWYMQLSSGLLGLPDGWKIPTPTGSHAALLLHRPGLYYSVGSLGLWFLFHKIL